MNWLYQGQQFNNSMIPENAEGFVYEMQATIDGKLVKYIGKKNFYSSVKKRFGKRALAQVTDKRTKKYTVVKKESYRLSSFAHANCLIVLDENTTHCAIGEKVTIHLLPE
mgnify:CR=1 FL=1